MKTALTQRRPLWPALLVLLAIFALVLWLGWLTPMYADDYSYAVSFVTKQPIESLGDLVESQLSHYAGTNGRTVVHTIGQLLLAWGEPWCDILCAAAFAALCLMICWHGLGGLDGLRGAGPLWLLLVFAGLWFLTPAFGSSFLWTIGAANYLWGVLIVLLSFIPFRRALNGGGGAVSPGREAFRAVGGLLLGLLGGWTNENTGAALLVLMAGAMLALLLQKRRLRPWMGTAFLGALAGVLLIVLCPAQQNRLAGAGGMGGFSDWCQRLLHIGKYACLYFWPLILIAAALLALALWKCFRRQLSWQALLTPAVYALGALCAAFSMILSPQFPDRVWSGILALCLIVPLALVQALRARAPAEREGHPALRRALPWTALVVSLALCAAVAVSAGRAGADLSRTRAAFDTRAKTIAAALDAGERDLTVEILTSCSRYNCYSMGPELETDPTDWKNVAQANYWGLDSIVAASED